MAKSSENKLAVIGAGFGRTGTLSMCSALNILGLGPTHHMFEVVKEPAKSVDWMAAREDKSILRDLLADYGSTVDWPSAYFWRDLIDMYPEAKVILTHRESKGWYKSIHSTLYQFISTRSDKVASQQLDMATAMVMNDTFDGRLGEEDYAIEVYEKHNELVKATVPPERLLVFDVREGWAPLCEFLEVPVPEGDFPRTNSSEELINHEAFK